MLELKKNNILIYNGKEYYLSELGLFVEGILNNINIKNNKLCITSNNHFILIDSVFYLFRNKIDSIIIKEDVLNEQLIKNLTEKEYLIINIEGDKIKFVNDLNPNKDTLKIVPGRISVLTSGTTGTPKIISHTWESLFTLRRKKSDNISEYKWLLTYYPGTYAWYQMLTMLMFVPNQSLVISNSTDPEDILDIGILNNVNAISATPTFFRYIILKKGQEIIKRLNLKQITLGGEPVDQFILDLLIKIFPNANITHIYASTEVGATIIVNDKKEGFPIEWLVSEEQGSIYDPEKPLLKIIDNILWVKSPYSSSQVSDWYNTGDMVEIKNNRVIIVGRADKQIINIGGLKIKTRIIEEALLKSNYVIWCRVYTKKTVVGQIVVADIVLNKRDNVPNNIEYVLTEHCLHHGVPDWAIPRIFNIMDEIPITKNYKTQI